MQALFTIDVEDYFHTVEGEHVPKLAQWDALPTRVEKNTQVLLDILDEYKVKSTCFVLGYVARRHPDLVREISRRGHEVASHGMNHKHVYEMAPEEFAQDLETSKKLLEDICGNEVLGFRSPGFSYTDSSPWFFDKLIDKGYSFDSSVFPAARFEGGIKTDQFDPHWVTTSQGRIFEFPITVAPVFGKNICFFGGGYLRLFPKWMIVSMAKKLQRAQRNVLYYIHPREIDPSHPRFKMNALNSFRSYVNLKTVEGKLRAILKLSEFINCRDYLQQIKLQEDNNASG